MTARLTLKETSKQIRKELKETFRDVKFSVKTETYAGGQSVVITKPSDVNIEDVRFIADKYAGATFNSIDDSTKYEDACCGVNPCLCYVHIQNEY